MGTTTLCVPKAILSAWEKPAVSIPAVDDQNDALQTLWVLAPVYAFAYRRIG
jgi:hypothetical protein